MNAQRKPGHDSDPGSERRKKKREGDPSKASSSKTETPIQNKTNPHKTSQDKEPRRREDDPPTVTPSKTVEPIQRPDPGAGPIVPKKPGLRRGE